MTLSLVPNTAEIEAKTSRELALAESLVIETQIEYVQAAEFLKGLKALQREIDATFDESIAKAFAAHKSIVAAKKKHSEPLERAERIVKMKAGAYAEEQERIRRAEEQRLAEEARKREEARLLAEAALAEEAGDSAEADAIFEEAETVQAPVISLQPSTPKVAGISFREEWDFQIENEKLIPREFLAVDMVKIRAVVKAMKGSTRIPGVRAFSRNNMAARRP